MTRMISGVQRKEIAFPLYQDAGKSDTRHHCPPSPREPSAYVRCLSRHRELRRQLTIPDNERKVLRLWEMEVHDLAATKLKSFRTHDRQDLQLLCNRGLLDPRKLRASLEAAYPFSLPGKDDD